MTATTLAPRRPALLAAIRVEALGTAWMVVEAVLAIGAGVMAHSALLTVFGIDSVIELLSGGVLLWRLLVEAGGRPETPVERAERLATWVCGLALTALCLYVVATAAWGLAAHIRPERSWLGIGIALAALVAMPLLARAKRRLADRLDSAALRADASCSLTCAAMAGALLVGLLLDALLGWWWAEYLAALAFLRWLIPDARGALAAARAGHAGCGCDE